MDELLPQQLVKTSIDTLRQASNQIQREEDQILALGIQKAIGILEILVPEFNEVPVEAVDESIADFTYTPEVLPLDKLLDPISEENRGGENLRLSGDVNKLLSLVINRTHSSDFRPDYHTLHEQAIELLSTRGKDLGVAIRLVEASIVVHESSGFAAVADGLLLLNGFVSNLWEDFVPLCYDGDCMARCNELEQFEELITMRLKARYGEPHEFNPEFSDSNAAGREAAIFAVIFEQLEVLKKSLYEKLDDQAPGLQKIKTDLDIFGRRINERFDALKQQIKNERIAVARQREQQINTAIEKVSEEIDKQLIPEEEATPAVSVEPRDISEASCIIDSCARYFITHEPSDPIGYLVSRGQRWFSRSSNNSTVTPSREQQQKIAELFFTKQWEDLFKNCEELFINGAHHWIDLQRYQVIAAEQLGSDYETTAQCIKSALMQYVRQNDKVLENNIDEKTPAASAETAQWIHREIAACGNGGSDGNSAAHSDTVLSNELRKANELSKNGKNGAALNLLLFRQNQSRSKRERFLWQLAIAEFCIQKNMTKLALPAIENMVETIDRLNLAEWEDPDLLTRTFKIGYNGYLSLGIDRAPEEKLEFFYRRICLYDPAHFISSDE